MSLSVHGDIRTRPDRLLPLEGALWDLADDVERLERELAEMRGLVRELVDAVGVLAAAAATVSGGGTPPVVSLLAGEPDTATGSLPRLHPDECQCDDECQTPCAGVGRACPTCGCGQ